MVRAHCLHYGGPGSIPVWGNKMPQGLWAKKGGGKFTKITGLHVGSYLHN